MWRVSRKAAREEIEIKVDGEQRHREFNILMRELEKLLKGAIRTTGAALGAKLMATGRTARSEQAIEAIVTYEWSVLQRVEEKGKGQGKSVNEVRRRSDKGKSR